MEKKGRGFVKIEKNLLIALRECRYVKEGTRN